MSIEAQGHWTGYVENPEPTLGSDALDLTFEVGADGALHGRVIFGEGPPPPPPTDPHMVWPEPGPGKGGLVYLDAAAIAFSLQQPVVGVPLTARDIRWQAGRLRFSVNMREAWAPWCDLQTPYPSLSRGGYTCAPDIGPIMVATDGTTHLCYANSVEEPAFDCRWSVACNAGICDCTASACAGVAEPNSDWPRFRFDIALRGDEGDGSLEMFNVRLVRASR